MCQKIHYICLQEIEMTSEYQREKAIDNVMNEL